MALARPRTTISDVAKVGQEKFRCGGGKRQQSNCWNSSRGSNWDEEVTLMATHSAKWLHLSSDALSSLSQGLN